MKDTHAEAQQGGFAKLRLLLAKTVRPPFPRSLGFCALSAIFLNAVIESLSRRSPLHALEFLTARPAAFLLNAFILFVALSTMFLVRRRVFVHVVWYVLFIAVGTVNGVILSFRMTPFTMTDLSLLDAGLSVIPNYLSTGQIYLAVAAAVAVVLLFVGLFLFAPKRRERVPLARNAAGVALGAALLALSLFVGVRAHAVETFFGNLNYAYRDYGTVYCFLNTWLNTGIHRPWCYSEAAVRSLITDGDAANPAASAPGAADDRDAPPNLVFLQLESFIDPSELTGLTLSEPATPYFHRLREMYSSGYLTVPSIGAGTANTEFEVLSGMSVKFFGPGEYPYKSVLKDTTCETLAYALKPLGYTAHAIHNHRGAFYGRNRVFANLGFDSFTSLEYMNNVMKTPQNWAKDGVLTAQILGALASTDGRDFVYAISVQGHGSYPTRRILRDPIIRIEGLETEAERNEFEYWLLQMREMDDFLRELTNTLDNCGEPVVLVLYGDHLPALNIAEDDMANGSVFETQYVIWDNFGLKKEDADLFSYQLAAHVEARIGLSAGTLQTYHLNHREDADYADNLRLLQYDMLYGSRFVYGGASPYKPVDLRMGFAPIRIREIIQIRDEYYISGEGFTPFSKVSIDGEVLDTIFLGPTILKLLQTVKPEDAARMRVSQVEKNKEILSTTE